jgi:hypothetical protein
LTGTPCNADNTLCTTDDSCEAGVCAPGVEVACDPASGQCQENTCDAATGKCSEKPLTGTPCDDDNTLCTKDSCAAGICAPGAEVVCDPASGQCQENTCDAATGECSEKPLTGTMCDDDNACTAGDFCVAGSCSGSNACGASSTTNDCSAKFTGGGMFFPNWTFGFNAKGTVGGAASGHDNEINHLTGQHINGPVTAITCVNSNRSMTFKVKDKKTGCVWIVTVTDNGEPGTLGPDTIIKTLEDPTCPIGTGHSPMAGGPVTSGNIQGHPPH